MSALLPMLATPARLEEVAGPGWAYELKWDGARALVEVTGGRVRVTSRTGRDTTARYPELGALAEAVSDAVLDGELMVLDRRGRPDFAALGHRLHRTAVGPELVRRWPVVYAVFDLLRLEGRWLLEEPYRRRRQALEDLGLTGRHWYVPPTLDDLEVAVRTAADLGLEGIVAKRLDSPYRPGVRSPDWRKVRLAHRYDLVVGGYTAGRGSRAATFGALLLGAPDASGALHYVGRVGSGFAEQDLDRLRRQLRPRDDSPFVEPVEGPATFVDPEVVVAVRAAGLTANGRLRSPVFLAVREDVSGPDGADRYPLGA